MTRNQIVSVRAAALASAAMFAATAPAPAQIGSEVAIEQHLADGDEFLIPLTELVDHGQALFEAVWTDQEGGGRPQTKGTGAPLADPFDPLDFPRNFNRLSAPDANSCAGCHNVPRSGGGGDIVANVFVLGQRFDFATFDGDDTTPTKGTVDENGDPVQMQTLANSRNTLGMFGAGYIEMLSREMTTDLQAIRDGIPAGGAAGLVTKGVSFGTLARNGDGTWDTSAVEGLSAGSLASSGANSPPNLVIKPFHQAGAVVSLREFTNNAFNHHHGIQATERFGEGVDPDEDGFFDELTRADVTAAAVFQAQLAVPGRVIPRDPAIEAAVQLGEQRFLDIGCATCHVPELPLTPDGRYYTEPNPFNPPGNLRPGDGVPDLVVDLESRDLDLPRLTSLRTDVSLPMVPAFTDLKLHDITDGPEDPNREPLDMHQPAGSAGFLAGNSRFLTRKLWGVANEPPFFHHGQYTTMRTAIEAHRGEALGAYQGWSALNTDEQNGIIEFLKTLQVLPPGTETRIVDENGQPRRWTAAWQSAQAPDRPSPREPKGPGKRRSEAK